MTVVGDALPIAVTSGDPAGIGPDIILAAWQNRRAHDLPLFVVFADPDALGARADQLGLAVAIDVHDRIPEHLSPDALTVIATRCAVPVVAGQPAAANGPAVINAIEAAVAAVAGGSAAGICTGPIAKSVLQESGFRYPGHTEFLGALAGTYWPEAPARRPEMLLASAALKVVPMTIHVPLAEVPGLVSKARLAETIDTVLDAMRVYFAMAQPRIAVAGLNPHAGENGRIGTEDGEIITPVVAAYANKGVNITGPHSADTLFHAEARATYDIVIAMYHDQALIPIKTIAFDTGVNVTLGLPFIRTSPDHGTAFDIAGTGKARASSFIAALHMARQMSEARTQAYGAP